MVLSLIAKLSGLLQRPHTQRRFIEDAEFPAHLRTALREKYPHLTDADASLVLEGLRDWFRLCHLKGLRLLAMPSQVVDDAWHAFVLDTRAYEKFCRSAFGRLLHHVPAEAMPAPTRGNPALRRTWRAALRLDGQNPWVPVAVPRLFDLDRRLRIPGGYRYAIDCRFAPVPGIGQTYCGSHLGSGSTCGGAGPEGGWTAGFDCWGDGGGDGGGGCGGGCGGGGD